MADFSRVQDIASKIQSIEIQGATNVAKAGFKIMEEELQRQTFSDYEELHKFTKQASQLLMLARDTEPMLFNGLTYALSVLEEEGQKVTQSVSEESSMSVMDSSALLQNDSSILQAIQQKVADSYQEFLHMIKREKVKRIEIGTTLIDEGDNIVNHCHSSSAVDILIGAHRQGKNIHVYNTETRPLYQGRITSTDLVNAGVPTTMITDSTAGFFIDNLYESHVHINKVIIGCDAIKLNGDVINKVGSFNIGLSAWHSGIPLYIAGSLLKVDTVDSIEIEQRSPDEVWPERPEQLDIINYAFDMIPAKCVTGIITEFGVIPPWELKNTIKKYHPWMLGEK
ncbi:MAG: hypothetical protein CR971_01545 [candidate division SR1 bacterium]|nr:MAG: hypothetical protein CR971_01545 [candidate division SR1 bacterium]